MIDRNIELLAPVGNPEALDAAIGEGADAVYLGLKNFNARLRSSNFAYNQFEAIVEAVHARKKKVYVTVNTVFEQREADRLYQTLQYLEGLAPDGIIVQDLGIIKMVAENFPKLKLHASTQMNIASSPAVNFLSKYGFKRIVLSRELSLNEIQSIRANTNMELEVFVHGALCVSASGLCLFSSYLGGRSANRGACTQACRRMYQSENKDGYFFSPDDLELLEKIPQLAEAGVNSIKIEGRMKSSEYVGSVVAAYRHMLDNWQTDPEKSFVKAKSILQYDFARKKTLFYFNGEAETNFIRPEQSGGTGISLGKVKLVRVFDEKRWMLVKNFSGIAEGDSIRIHAYGDIKRSTAKIKGVQEKPEGLFLQIDEDFGLNDEIYLVQTKSMSKRYKNIMPKSLSKYHAFPSYDKAPAPSYKGITREALSVLGEGNYVMVNKVEDLHTILSDRPEKAIIRFSRKNAELLRRHEKTIPFKRNSLIFWLEPFFAEADSTWLTDELNYWVESGQKIFIANNIGHLALLKKHDVSIVAGPWLYAFNAWAASFLFDAGASFICPPLEISKQAFYNLLSFVQPKTLMPVVFAYPQLFTIRTDLTARFDLRFFSDKTGDEYELVSTADNSVVIPIKPFSIIDRMSFIKKDGVGKFLFDFSFVELRKQIYKRIMASANNALFLPDTERFNWKDGFWNPDAKPSDKQNKD